MTDEREKAAQEALKDAGGIRGFKEHSGTELFVDAFLAGAAWQRERDAEIIMGRQRLLSKYQATEWNLCNSLIGAIQNES